MKIKNLKSFSLLLILAGTLIVSCSDDDELDNEVTDTRDATQTEILSNFVDNVVVVTYKNLADAALELSALCDAIDSENPTQESIQAACEQWIVARQYWERSEAFLFGAASDYNIDPHIDSWPLDQTALDNLMNNDDTMEALADEETRGDAISTLGYGLLGFHAVEYVLFSGGEARSATDIPGKEIIFSQAIAEDLAFQAVRLEASWAGLENVTSVKQTVLTENELEPTINYGDALKDAGLSGNTLYPSLADGFAEILGGATDIADEVGNTKIADPISSGNVLDVESWYSYNSIEDFANNIRSIQYAFLGNTDGTENTYSVKSYIETLDAELADEIESYILDAISKIEAMPAPFRDHLDASDTDIIAAQEACNTLMNALNEAQTAVYE